MEKCQKMSPTEGTVSIGYYNLTIQLQIQMHESCNFAFCPSNDNWTASLPLSAIVSDLFEFTKLQKQSILPIEAQPITKTMPLDAGNYRGAINYYSQESELLVF